MFANPRLSGAQSLGPQTPEKSTGTLVKFYLRAQWGREWISQNWGICNVFLWKDPPKFAWALKNSNVEGPGLSTRNVYREPCIFFFFNFRSFIWHIQTRSTISYIQHISTYIYINNIIYTLQASTSTPATPNLLHIPLSLYCQTWFKFTSFLILDCSSLITDEFRAFWPMPMRCMAKFYWSIAI